MNSVFLLYRGSHEDRVAIGAFGTLEGAQAAHDGGHEAKWVSHSPGYWSCEWEHIPDPAPPPAAMTFDTVTIPVIDGVAVLPDGRKVRTSARFVDVPQLPKGFTWPAIDTYRDCDYAIAEMPVGD